MFVKNFTMEVMMHEGMPAPKEVEIGFELDEHPKDECGVFAIYAPGEAVCDITYRALKGLQHRGQSGAGIAFFENGGYGLEGVKKMAVVKDAGLVEEALGRAVDPQKDGTSRLDNVSGTHLALGHARWTTADSDEIDDMHPFLKGRIAVAHNGHVQAGEARSDSAWLAEKVSDAVERHDGDVVKALEEELADVEGAYNLVISDGKDVYAVRDPWGFHPLALGELKNGKGYVVSSESIVFKKSIEATYVRDVEPGEILKISETGISSSYIHRYESPRNCMFEYIYTARADGIINGVSVYRARKLMGRYLAEDSPVEADVVVGVPNSGLPASTGFSEVSEIERVDGIFKNPFVSRRTFQARGHTQSQSLEEKFQLNSDELFGKRVVLVDDSLIKGRTMRQLVKMIRDEGAIEVHVRSSAARYLYPCYMGMDTGDPADLIARTHTDEEIAAYIGADSVAFNSVARIEQAVREAQVEGSINAAGALCTACATGEYPLKLAENLVVDLPLPAIRQAALAMSR